MVKKQLQPFPGAVLESISKIIGDTQYGLTGAEITKFLAESNIPDTDPGITKWKRLYNAFVNYQNREKKSIKIQAFIQKSMSPARYIGRQDLFESQRYQLNTSLGFVSLEFTDSGKFKIVTQTNTLTEAAAKAQRLKEKLQNRNGHPKIYYYCKAELVTDNYFHAVFEAVKGIAEEIRIRTGLTSDGSILIDDAFSSKSPRITINNMSSETEISEHKGFANLLKGVFGMFRNTTAHSPKVKWIIDEPDALDILSTISFIHRKLDNSQLR